MQMVPTGASPLEPTGDFRPLDPSPPVIQMLNTPLIGSPGHFRLDVYFTSRHAL